MNMNINKTVCVAVFLMVCLVIISRKQNWGEVHSWNMDVESQNLPIQKSVMFINKQKMKTDYLDEMEQLNMEKVKMDDSRLISLIRNYWIENPSNEPYNLTSAESLDPSVGQAAVVDNKLKFKEGGFYVECGALDGETRSNTLMFERLRKWNGLLIEADPKNYALLRKKHRKAFTINACLSVHPYPVKMKFKQHFNIGKLVSRNDVVTEHTVDVQCFPLYSILRAINVNHIDFFSLDVEGEELNVLHTIPFDKVDIEMMTVEFKHVTDGEFSLKQFVEQKGYSSILRVSHYNNLANDIIFRKRKGKRN